MSTTEIRDALRAVHDAVDVPPVDRVAFQAEVRAARRRRTSGRALVAVAAAGALVAGGLGIGAVLDGPDEPQTADSTSEVWDGNLTLVEHDGRLAALEPDGSLEDIGPSVDQLLGAPGSWMYVVDGGELDVRWAVPPYDDLDSAVEGPVQSAALSRDGELLAWLDADGRVHRYDTAAEREDLTFRVGAGAEVVDVAEAGVLLEQDGRLSLTDGRRSVAVPVPNDGTVVDAQLAERQVLVNDSSGESVLYDVSGDAAEVVGTFDAPGELSFLGELALVRPHGLEIRRAGAPVRTTFEGVTLSAARWAGGSRLVATGQDASGAAVLYSCRFDLRCTRLPVDGEVTLLR